MMDDKFWTDTYIVRLEDGTLGTVKISYSQSLKDRRYEAGQQALKDLIENIP